MATPTISSTVNFVKKYPITLCGFSLLFMPSVHRLLLYFSPLLLSTAIFIVAMLSWGPSMSSAAESRGKRRGTSNEWAFNGSLKIYGEEEEEEEEEEVGEMADAPSRKISEGIAQQEDISITAKATKKPLEPQLQEPDPDFDEENNRVGIASTGAISGGQAQPDPDFHEDCVDTASSVVISEPGHDLSGDCVGTASTVAINSCGQAEPDPDLHGDRMGSARSDEADARGDCVGTAFGDDAMAAGDADRCETDPDLHGEQEELTAAKHLPDHHRHDNHCHIEPAPTSPDQPAACDHHNYHDGTEHDHDLHAGICMLQEQLGVKKRSPSPYSDDACDRHSQQRLRTLQAAA